MEGDAVGVKNIYVSGGAKPKRRPGPLPDQLTESIRRAFVEPDGWADVRAAFAKRRIVLLCGAAGYGKQGAAIRLFLGTGHRPVYQIDGTDALSQLADLIGAGDGQPGSWGQGAGFLVDQPVDITSLHVGVLQGLETALKQADARLVLTLGSEVVLPDHDLRDYGYVVDLPSRPDTRKVFISHLASLMGGEQADRLLTLGNIQKLRDKHITPEGTCAFAAFLAARIAERCDGAQEPDAAIIDKIKEDVERYGADFFETWFTSLPDPQFRAFAVALAVFGGLPYESVAMAARALYERFDGAPPYLVISSDLWYTGRAPRLSKLRAAVTARRERLRILRAHITKTEAGGLYGSTELIDYDDADYAAKVLHYAWSAYEIQDILIDWLCELAESESVQIRIFTARALGLLASRSFDYLGTSVLRPWAASKRDNRRQAVAYALWKAVSEDPRLLVNARLLVRGWYAAAGHPAVQATAARVYGLALGPADLADAIQALNRLLIVGHPMVTDEIGNAMADLMAPVMIDGTWEPLADGAAAVVHDVLTGLVASVADRDRSEAAQRAFLTVADQLLSQVLTGGGVVSWPSLLHLMTRLPAVRGAIVSLWQRVLNDALWHDEAGAVITNWAAVAEADPAVREAFLRLARALVRGQPRCRLILERYSAEWVNRRSLQPMPVISAALQSILAAESEV